MILPLADLPAIGPFADPRSSMRGPYLIRDAKKAAAVRLVDAALRLWPKLIGELPAQVDRVLLANWAHLGDVTTTIAAVSAVRARYPSAEIGMLVGSWGRAAIEGAGLIDRIHVADHWMLNRSDLTAAAKFRHYVQTRAAAVQELRNARYQVAIDLYPFFPPAHPLFRRAGIPVRIGYTSGGFGPLLSHPVRWRDEERPMADQYRDLLDLIDPRRPFEPVSFRPNRDRGTLAPLPPELANIGPYLVVHPGAGSPTRHWGEAKWRTLMHRMRADAPEHSIVLTGAGAGDVALAKALASDVPGTINMVGRADWEAFTRILADARLVICPDTATGHVAAQFDVPTIVLFTGTNSPAKWAPYNPNVTVLTRPVRCAPCNRTGCEAMACFHEVTPDHVADAALARLATDG